MNKEDGILVSVVMAEYNTVLSQLKDSIDSILNQTYANFELIIIDDCGKNDLHGFLSKYNDDRIRLIKNKKNLGLAESLNIGVKAAKGEYILRMDTDDISFPNRIEKQLKFALKNPDYSIIGSKYILFDENNEYGIRGKSGLIQKCDFLKGTPFAHPTLLIKKNDLVNSGLYPNYYRCQDYAMEMQMYSCGYKGFIMDDALLKYRQDNNGYKKKKFKYRIIEYKIRKKYFKILKFPIYRLIFQLKPIIVGLFPVVILKNYHKLK